MARLFDITTTNDTLPVQSGKAEKLVFTVTNTTQKPQRGTLRAHALDSGQAGWVTLEGDAERNFPAGFTHQVELTVKVPPETPSGKFRVRLDALSVANPDDDFTEGPAVGVAVTAPAAPKPNKMPWWIWVVAGVVLLVIAGVVTYLVRRGHATAPPDTPPPTASQPASEPPPKPAEAPTQEFNDPRVHVAQGDLPLDVCRDWGTNCGKPAADAYCNSQGWASAVDFRIAMDSPPTVVIASKAVCDGAACDRITWVKCTTVRRSRIRLNAQTLRHLETMQLKGKQVEP